MLLIAKFEADAGCALGAWGAADAAREALGAATSAVTAEMPEAAMFDSGEQAPRAAKEQIVKKLLKIPPALRVFVMIILRSCQASSPKNALMATGLFALYLIGTPADRDVNFKTIKDFDRMIPRRLIDTAPIPGGGELRLVQRGEEFSIMLGATELMNSRISGSEEALADLSCAKIAERVKAEILIGGLGMGFTLRAALARLGRDAEVTVTEIVPAVIAWARGPMAHIFAGSLDDARVRVMEADVGDLIGSARSRYDAILLDVDNGPDGLTLGSNERLYDRSGLAAARLALRPGGVLAVWSSAPDIAFSARLRKVGFEVEEVVVRANRGRRGGRHVIWIASRAQ